MEGPLNYIHNFKKKTDSERKKEIHAMPRQNRIQNASLCKLDLPFLREKLFTLIFSLVNFTLSSQI